MQPQTKSRLYGYLEDLPEVLTGEILDGQLHTRPRPSGPHGFTGSMLGAELLGPFHKGSGGPGGWWIIDEPEIHFVHDVEVTVPDLAGWRRERMPMLPTGHRFEVVPDWMCEILSPSTASKDREIKMPLYAHYGVQFAWLIDPIKHVLEAYRLDAGTWHEIGRLAGTDRITVPPFDAVSIDLKSLWPPRL